MGKTPGKLQTPKRLRARKLKNEKPAVAKSYGGRCREDRIRTCDPLVPNQVRYQIEVTNSQLITQNHSFFKELSGPNMTQNIVFLQAKVHA